MDLTDYIIIIKPPLLLFLGYGSVMAFIHTAVV